MKITVFGATGGIGGQVVAQALEAGHKVTAVVRDVAVPDSAVRDSAARGPAGPRPASRGTAGLGLDHPALEVVTVPGLTDPDALRPALEASEAVISGVGPRSRKAGPVASSTASGILAAMAASGVRRLVAVSAAPVGPLPAGESFANRRIMLPFITALLRDTYADLAAMEDEIRRSATDWTVVRPPRLVNKPLTGAYRTCVGGNVPRGRSISRPDVAHLMLAVLDDPATICQAVGIAY